MCDWYLMVCKTCKTAEWHVPSDLPEYIIDHQDHHITPVTSKSADDREAIKRWCMRFTNWDKEAENL